MFLRVNDAGILMPLVLHCIKHQYPHFHDYKNKTSTVNFSMLLSEKLYFYSIFLFYLPLGDD